MLFYDFYKQDNNIYLWEWDAKNEILTVLITQRETMRHLQQLHHNRWTDLHTFPHSAAAVLLSTFDQMEIIITALT